MIRVTIQFEDEKDENKVTVVSSAFQTFEEIADSDFLQKVKSLDFTDEENYKKKKKKRKKKNQCIGFSGPKVIEEKGDE